MSVGGRDERSDCLDVVDDGSRIVALGELTLSDVSSAGRYVTMREQVTSDASRWILLDLDDAAMPLSPSSTRAGAGDIVGPPRFVSDDVVVTARLCATLESTDDRPDGDVQIEAVDLSVSQPAGGVLWSTAVTGLGVNDFLRSVELSARRDADGTIWALVAGNGGLEQSSQTVAVSDTETIEITRLGFQTFAFRPSDLITEFDSPQR